MGLGWGDSSPGAKEKFPHNRRVTNVFTASPRDSVLAVGGVVSIKLDLSSPRLPRGQIREQ